MAFIVSLYFLISGVSYIKNVTKKNHQIPDFNFLLQTKFDFIATDITL